MAAARAIRIQRVTLSAASLTAVAPPAAFTQCYVGNGTGADLQIHTNDDTTEYRVLSANAERPLRALKTNGFRTTETAFWLLSAGGGLVILEWT